MEEPRTAPPRAVRDADRRAEASPVRPVNAQLTPLRSLAAGSAVTACGRFMLSRNELRGTGDYWYVTAVSDGDVAATRAVAKLPSRFATRRDALRTLRDVCSGGAPDLRQLLPLRRLGAGLYVTRNDQFIISERHQNQDVWWAGTLETSSKPTWAIHPSSGPAAQLLYAAMPAAAQFSSRKEALSTLAAAVSAAG